MLAENPLYINEKNEIDKITSRIKHVLQADLHKRGLVVAISGGVDSAVSTALCVKAIGPKKVFGLILPEHDSSPDSVSLGEMLAKQFGIEYMIQDIAPTLEAIGCYSWRDDAIRAVFPDYRSNWKSKIVIAGGSQGKINHFQLVVQKPDNEIMRKRLGLKEYLQIVAATNYKQRIRKTVEYFHADRLNYAVVGTPNRLEYDQGFFVKNGDGSADIKPIAHLYKTQVYTLARYLSLPAEICTALPTTDTYSMTQGQDEFYFTLPYKQMDLALWALNHNISASKLAEMLEMDVKQAEYVYKDIVTKRKTTAHLHSMPYLIENVLEFKD
jgi:NAD+ synthase